MEVYKTDKKLYIINELKSWALTAILILVYLLCIKLFFPLKYEQFITGTWVLFFLRLADFLTQFHVHEIIVGKETNQLVFKLISRMSGPKIKTYDLQAASSQIKHRSGLASLFASPVTLKLVVSPKDVFYIRRRYGFTEETLANIHEEIVK